MEGVEPAFVMWVWAYDSEAAGPSFASLGLNQADAPKPARDAWQMFIAR